MATARTTSRGPRRRRRRAPKEKILRKQHQKLVLPSPREKVKLLLLRSMSFSSVPRLLLVPDSANWDQFILLFHITLAENSLYPPACTCEPR